MNPLASHLKSQSLDHPLPKPLSLRARGLKKFTGDVILGFWIAYGVFRTKLFTLSPNPSPIKGEGLKKSFGRAVSPYIYFWVLIVRRLFLLLALLFVIPVQAQEVTQEPPPPVLNDAIRAEFQVDNTSPLLGEPFNVTLVVEASSDIEILTWVEFDEPVEVLEAGEVESEVLVSEMRHTRNYEVVLWDVGEYLSPEILLTYRQGGATNSVAVSSFFVQVPVQIINAEDAVARPLKSPIDLPYTSPTIYIGIGIGVFILLLIVARLIQISRKNVVQIVRASPAEKAIAVLEDLKVQNLSPASIYELVANHLREYIQSQFAIEAVEMTTVELMAALREQDIFPKEHRNRLQKVLEQADLVKFARFQPEETHSTRLVNFAIKWLKETERLQKDD